MGGEIALGEACRLMQVLEVGLFDGGKKRDDHEPRGLVDHTIDLGESLNLRIHLIHPLRPACA
jgi:hypothetical protein